MTVSGGTTNYGVVVVSDTSLIRIDEGTLPTFTTSTALCVINNSATTDDVNLAIISGTAANSRINFGDSGDDNIGYIDYDNNDNSMIIGTNGTTYITLSSAGNITHSASNVGDEVTNLIRNTDNTNSASHARLQLSAGGTSGGDTKLQMGISGGQDWVLGIDNSDTDSFVISNNTSLGTTNALRIGTDRGLGLVDGITAPSATVGYAKIFVDTADGDLKVIFGDGTTKLIVADT